MTEKSLRFAAIIAAAGASARMGHPKALLPFGNQTFVVRAVSEMLLAGASTVVVTLSDDNDGMRIRQTLRAHFDAESRLLTCPNEWMERGYSGSLQSGMQHCTTADAWLMMPVDAPFFTAGLVEKLLAPLAAGHDAAVPRVAQNWGHPVAFSQRMAAKIATVHETGGPRALLESLGQRLAFVQWPDRRVTWNLNTPDAYRDAFPEHDLPDGDPRG